MFHLPDAALGQVKHQGLGSIERRETAAALYLSHRRILLFTTTSHSLEHQRRTQTRRQLGLELGDGYLAWGSFQSGEILKEGSDKLHRSSMSQDPATSTKPEATLPLPPGALLFPWPTPRQTRPLGAAREEMRDRRGIAPALLFDRGRYLNCAWRLPTDEQHWTASAAGHASSRSDVDIQLRAVAAASHGVQAPHLPRYLGSRSSLRLPFLRFALGANRLPATEAAAAATQNGV
uniref:Uncharacterized protein n=1 Tax=Mycena chlorophos TaxID=658473 RepID=A0ABQ0LU93_MYCCL|nr:predicted protein [Mycena chlorophos]